MDLDKRLFSSARIYVICGFDNKTKIFDIKAVGTAYPIRSECWAPVIQNCSSLPACASRPVNRRLHTIDAVHASSWNHLYVPFPRKTKDQVLKVK